MIELYNGDCTTIMKDISNKPIDEEKIVFLYTVERKTLRTIAKENYTNHHKIKKVLQKHGVKLNNSNRVRTPMTEECKRKISMSSKGRKTTLGKKMPKESLYKNMRVHMRWDVSLKFLMSWEDIEKLKFLNKAIIKSRVAEHFNAELYKQFITKFYHDIQFNSTYEDWIKENKKQYARPSLDHIIPLSKGGTWSLENLQFLPWCVNRAKFSFLPDEWEYIKNKYFKE